MLMFFPAIIAGAGIIATALWAGLGFLLFHWLGRPAAILMAVLLLAAVVADRVYISKMLRTAHGRSDDEVIVIQVCAAGFGVPIVAAVPVAVWLLWLGLKI